MIRQERNENEKLLSLDPHHPSAAAMLTWFTVNQTLAKEFIYLSLAPRRRQLYRGSCVRRTTDV